MPGLVSPGQLCWSRLLPFLMLQAPHLGRGCYGVGRRPGELVHVHRVRPPCGCIRGFQHQREATLTQLPVDLLLRPL